MTGSIIWGGSVVLPRNFSVYRIAADTPTRLTRRYFFGWFRRSLIGVWEDFQDGYSPSRESVQFPSGSPAYTEISKFLQGV